MNAHAIVADRPRADLACLFRYFTFGALLGGFLADMISPAPVSVFGGALLFGGLFTFGKFKYLT
ncbi:MAG: hypothetical protein OIF48_06355 [Silicimonas sp.]|nr:hypothetical protein [Silicimonas sp.]